MCTISLSSAFATISIWGMSTLRMSGCSRTPSSGSRVPVRVGIAESASFDPAGRAAAEDVRSNCEIYIESYRDLPLERILSYSR